MRMKASVPSRRGGCSTINWSYGTPAGEATARASSAETVAGLSRRSTTTISLPMPFILANAWLASALIKFPISACLIWPVRADWPACAAGRMTYLSWDESRTGVLEMAGFSRQGRDKPRETLGRHWGWRILDEFDPLFPPCIVCAGPGGRDGAEPDFVRSRPGTGAVAARGKPDT